MKDPVFTGKDVGEALRLASRTLSIAQDVLRYVVLDPGSAGGRGLSPTEARIAVLFEISRPGVATQTTEPRVQDPRHDTEVDPASQMREVVRRLATASKQELDVEIREGRDTLDVHLVGPGTTLFFDDTGDTLTALEYLFERMYGRELEPLRIRLTCAGFREHRERGLQRRALEIAALVRADGVPRTTEPMNSYERRIIHVTLEQEVGVTTYSVGEGRERRVTIALSAAGDAPLPGNEGNSDQAVAPTVETATETVEEPVPFARDSAGEGARPGSTKGVEEELPLSNLASEPPPFVAAEARRPAEQAATTTAQAAAPSNAQPQTSPKAFDYTRFDRAPEGHGAPELM
jgi:spoIIIJ-associated protein